MVGFRGVVDVLRELPGKVVEALDELPQKVVDILDEREFCSGTASSQMSLSRFLMTSGRLRLVVRWQYLENGVIARAHHCVPRAHHFVPRQMG